MPYITRSYLETRAEKPSSRMLVKEADLHLKQSSKGAQVSVFLSHSHADRGLVVTVSRFLATFDLNVYVDWLDSAIPATTSPETATYLREKIDACDRFILLATERALASKWVPWELGYADGVKGCHKVAALPITEQLTDKWTGTEYVGIYSQIRLNDDRTDAVVHVTDATAPIPLRDWLHALQDRFDAALGVRG
jgi:hypothetical protein